MRTNETTPSGRIDSNRLANDSANYVPRTYTPAELARIVDAMELESDDYESGPAPLSFDEYYGTTRRSMAGGFDMD